MAASRMDVSTESRNCETKGKFSLGEHVRRPLRDSEMTSGSLSPMRALRRSNKLAGSDP